MLLIHGGNFVVKLEEYLSKSQPPSAERPALLNKYDKPIHFLAFGFAILAALLAVVIKYLDTMILQVRKI